MCCFITWVWSPLFIHHFINLIIDPRGTPGCCLTLALGISAAEKHSQAAMYRFTGRVLHVNLHARGWRVCAHRAVVALFSILTDMLNYCMKCHIIHCCINQISSSFKNTDKVLKPFQHPSVSALALHAETGPVWCTISDLFIAKNNTHKTPVCPHLFKVGDTRRQI